MPSGSNLPTPQTGRLKPLACPNCGQGFNPTDTKGSKRLLNDHPEKVTLRQYTCSNAECRQTYTTREMLTASALYDVKVVGRGGSERGARHDYSTDKLEADLAVHSCKRLTDSEQLVIISLIERRIEEHAASVRKSHAGSDAPIEIGVDELVRLALRGLADATTRAWHGHRDGRDRVRVAHAMYALGTLGRHDPRGQWKSAREFVEWMDVHYPHLKKRRPKPTEPDYDPHPAEWTKPPLSRPADPTTVVKNRYTSSSGSSSSEGPPLRAKREFEIEKVQRSIQVAFHGRDPKNVKSDKVLEYVMWGFVGQPVLRTSQLSSAIADALRAMDDIAYLRWVVIGKELDLAQLYDEAVGLLSHPSPRLDVRMGAKRRLE